MRRPAKSPSTGRRSTKPRPVATRAPAARPYHHGDLRRVLIDAAMQLVGEGGPEAVSVREAARRAGVSPGAPFRHFPSRDALMNAVAEEAQRRFRAEIEAALAEAPSGDPLGRFRHLGIAYLRWAMKNPTHFEIISSRRFFDHDRSAAVSSDNAELIGLTERTLAEAFSAGQLETRDLRQVQIAGRALVYGFARMHIDGHLPRWGVGDAEVEQMAADIVDLFIAGIASHAAPAAKV
ncbi:MULTISPECIES: TetR/AcrR family transcriptional regulator [Bradyrhizobium]|jgi:AcrR family transcriptional regulator|uniref:TetR/AcrR family transcriptional regulator n=1 Tax=Bradyrhizobium TaxID=374 RepID=UPI0004826C75|nr:MULTISPECIES: TetR/AcrR family transcriptional regulator [Bradyrhizobium]MCS3451599.1 AcrR family transcriptional regulator [Bradyrhizobium elkanii]MCS3566302.1 AcrR family transcriptional regulator [Bradyrhizobium elkanii]MCW2152968.1 AcrR family transcriptional regulator [Bradyrhizobium elkanii]MCW2357295.1 AcrR family transcriptional regulator [Bradyrhizobium elkanii]MCW2376701.1 AcrR family transcriptional regulator [Bradyrhizobium elkanii]